MEDKNKIQLKQVNENISNAFHIVRETHKQVDKLLGTLDEVAESENLECLTKGKFLSWQDILNPWGWLLSSFVKAYRNEIEYPNSVLTIETHFEDSPTLAFGIHLYKEGFIQEEHKDTNHGGIYSHRRIDETHGFTRQFKNDFFISKPSKKPDELHELHKDFLVFIFKEIPLLDITKNNLKDKVFTEFDNLYAAAYDHKGEQYYK